MSYLLVYLLLLLSHTTSPHLAFDQHGKLKDTIATTEKNVSRGKILETNIKTPNQPFKETPIEAGDELVTNTHKNSPIQKDIQKDEQPSTTTNKREPSRQLLEGVEAEVLEHARDKPTMFAAHYDLVGKWTGKTSKLGKSFHHHHHHHHHHQQQHHRNIQHHSELYRDNDIEFDGAYIDAEDTNENSKNLILKQLATNTSMESNQQNKTPTEMAVAKVKRHRSEGKMGGKRRHVTRRQNEEGWMEQWSGNGIFRTVSRCIDIPRNMSLCANIDYKVMRIPNLLQHNSIREVIEQSAYWTPLISINCHRDVQIFLCSLFAPVCLEKPVYPCRRTCEAVREGCEFRMKEYSFSWPEFLDCSNFPADTDLCVGLRPESEGFSVAPSSSATGALQSLNGHECNMCGEGLNVESFIDHYCEADVVLKTRLHSSKSINSNLFLLRLMHSGSRFMKGGGHKKAVFGRRRRRVVLQTDGCNCTQVIQELEGIMPQRAGRFDASGRNGRVSKSGGVRMSGEGEMANRLGRIGGRIRSKGKRRRMKNKMRKSERMGGYVRVDGNVVGGGGGSVQKNKKREIDQSDRKSSPSSPRHGRYMIMMKMMSERWVVMMIRAPKHPSGTTAVRQAFHLIHSNPRNICNSVN